jgi:DNA (cytosine-5)-methyltransferase 1
MNIVSFSVGAPHIRQRLFWVADLQDNKQQRTGDTRGRRDGFTDSSSIIRMADSLEPGLEGHAGVERQGNESGRKYKNPFRSACESRVIMCRDGKRRRVPVEPSLFPLADGILGRVALLRGAGNAIVPQVAAEFITTFMEST